MGRISLKGCLAVLLVCLAILIGFTMHARADLAASEADLNRAGEPYEVNPDAAGKLWVTEFIEGEVWGIDPVSGDYQVYPVGANPVDARQVGGYLWWADGMTNTLGMLSTSDGSFTQWQVPYAYGFNGTNLDTQGRFYATDPFFPLLYRLDTSQAQLCTITLSSSGNIYSIARDGDYLWMSDSYYARLFRLNVSNNSLNWWSLPVGSAPHGMAVDAAGNVWYADSALGLLAEFNPNTNQLSSYALPAGTTPRMIAYKSSAIWYTEQNLASLGRLDPFAADHTHTTLTIHNQTVTPSCEGITPSSSGTLSVSSGTLSWVSETYMTQVDAGGWKIYKLPKSSYPNGIALLADGYMADAGRQLLSRFSIAVTLAPTGTSTQVPVNIMATTPTPTNTSTSTPTSTNTPTQVPTNTPTKTQVPTDTPTKTQVPTNTQTPTGTSIVMNTATATATPTPTSAPGPNKLYLPLSLRQALSPQSQPLDNPGVQYFLDQLIRLWDSLFSNR